MHLVYFFEKYPHALSNGRFNEKRVSVKGETMTAWFKEQENGKEADGDE
ncbi:MAG: hypothetical protein HFG51_07245 [Lachnospiraceae bacterium]|nr:hypothetical protein [Lachnospiraceae bacterium]